MNQSRQQTANSNCVLHCHVLMVKGKKKSVLFKNDLDEAVKISNFINLDH